MSRHCGCYVVTLIKFLSDLAQCHDIRVVMSRHWGFNVATFEDSMSRHWGYHVTTLKNRCRYSEKNVTTLENRPRINRKCHDIHKNVATLEKSFGVDVATSKKCRDIVGIFLILILAYFLQFYSFLHTLIMLVNTILTRTKHLNSSMNSYIKSLSTSKV